jgi:hypothetical protein
MEIKDPSGNSNRSIKGCEGGTEADVHAVILDL